LAGSDCYLFKKYQISLIWRRFDDEDARLQRMTPMLNDDDLEGGFHELVVKLDACIQQRRNYPT
jgi:hypothetical protein